VSLYFEKAPPIVIIPPVGMYEYSEIVSMLSDLKSVIIFSYVFIRKYTCLLNGEIVEELTL
jgi:hypothetical protein